MQTREFSLRAGFIYGCICDFGVLGTYVLNASHGLKGTNYHFTRLTPCDELLHGGLTWGFNTSWTKFHPWALSWKYKWDGPHGSMHVSPRFRILRAGFSLENGPTSYIGIRWEVAGSTPVACIPPPDVDARGSAARAETVSGTPCTRLPRAGRHTPKGARNKPVWRDACEDAAQQRGRNVSIGVKSAMILYIHMLPTMCILLRDMHIVYV